MADTYKEYKAQSKAYAGMHFTIFQLGFKKKSCFIEKFSS